MIAYRGWLPKATFSLFAGLHHHMNYKEDEEEDEDEINTIVMTLSLSLDLDSAAFQFPKFLPSMKDNSMEHVSPGYKTLQA